MGREGSLNILKVFERRSYQERWRVVSRREPDVLVYGRVTRCLRKKGRKLVSRSYGPGGAIGGGEDSEGEGASGRKRQKSQFLYWGDEYGG